MPYSNVRPGSYGDKATSDYTGSRRSSKIHRKTSGLNGSLRNPPTPSSPLSGKDSLGVYPNGQPGSLPMNYQGSNGGFRGFAGVGTFSHANSASHPPSVVTSIQQTAKDRFYNRQPPARSPVPLHPNTQAFVSTRPEIQDDGPPPGAARLGVGLGVGTRAREGDGAAGAGARPTTERSSATLSYLTDPAFKGSPSAQQQAFNIAQSHYPPQSSVQGNGSRTPYGSMPTPPTPVSAPKFASASASAPGAPGFSPSHDDKRWSEYEYSPSEGEATNQWIPPPPGQGARRSAMLSQTSSDSSYGKYRPHDEREGGPSLSSGYPGPGGTAPGSWAGASRPSSEKPPLR